MHVVQERRQYLDTHKKIAKVSRRIISETSNTNLIAQGMDTKENIGVRLSEIIDHAVGLFGLPTTLSQLG
jgi:hypothetical protein